MSLDNNAAEWMIHGPVVTRKNARGSHNRDTPRNAAVIWTVTATAQMADLNVLTWLTVYLTNAAATAASRSPGRRWNGSCPGTPTAKTSAPGHSHRPPDKPARITPSSAWAPSVR